MGIRFEKIREIFIIAALSAIVLLTGCSQDDIENAEFEYDEKFVRVPLTVVQRINKTRIDLSGLLIMELETTIDQAVELTAPEIGPGLEKFKLRDWKNLPDRLSEEGQIIRTSRYRLEALEPGKWYMPAFEYTFKDGDESAEGKTLATQPVEITVQSLIAEQGGDLVIEDIEDVVEMKASKLPLVIIATVGWVLIAVVVLAVFLLRRKKASLPIRIFKYPHEIAFLKLVELEQENLIEAGDYKLFYEKLSDVLRHYIEHRFALKAPERTTEEFLIEMQSTDVLNAKGKTDLAKFLEHCDLIKFARHEATDDQMRAGLQLVESFIADTKTTSCRIDIVTGQRFILQGVA